MQVGSKALGKFGISKTRSKTLNEDGGRDEQSRLLEAGDNSNLRAMRPDRAVRGETEPILIHSPRGARLWKKVPVAWRAVQSEVDGFALYSPLGFVVSFCLLPFQT